MRLLRKAAMILVVVALTGLSARMTSAAPFSNCVSISSNYGPQWHVIRDTNTGQGSAYYAAQGETVVRQLRACTNANGTAQQSCASQVWPANMQGASEFKQVGYATVGSVSDPPTCGSSAMNFWATCCAGSTSVVTKMSLAFYPTIGDNIRFSIYRYAPGGFVYWRLKVDDLSHAGWYGWRELILTGSSVPLVWYGAELYNKQTQFGSASTVDQVRLRGLSYRLSHGGAWNYLTGSLHSAWGSEAGLGHPSCWHGTIGTYSGPYSPSQTTLNAWTSC